MRLFKRIDRAVKAVNIDKYEDLKNWRNMYADRKDCPFTGASRGSPADRKHWPDRRPCIINYNGSEEAAKAVEAELSG